VLLYDYGCCRSFILPSPVSLFISPSPLRRTTELPHDYIKSLSPQKARASSTSALTAEDDFDYDTSNSISEEESEMESEEGAEEEAPVEALSPPRRRNSTMNSLGSALPFEDSPEHHLTSRYV
jgi:hypothetical protein